MQGDIIYVVREPLWFKSFSVRRTSKSTLLDQLIARTIKYRHYGVEVEDGYVIHFISDSICCLDEAMVKKTTIEEFLKDGVKQVDHSFKSTFSREKIVKRAYSRLNTKFTGYNLLSNNCEHFAAWCALGNKVSRQVYIGKRGQNIIMFPIRAKRKIVQLIAAI